MNPQFLKDRFAAHRVADHIPSRGLVKEWLERTLWLLFPAYSPVRFYSQEEFTKYANECDAYLVSILDVLSDKLPVPVEEVRKDFSDKLPDIYTTLIHDAESILIGDPAAKSMVEVISTYPGFYALAVHRLAHCLCKKGVPLVPRMLSEIAHSKTGIDIHPGATIGDNFCIDHGTGIVIGETVVIGKNVKIYQGVTLGALSVKKELARIKRHPTIGDNVVIYAGATILGGDTIIGEGSIIGGNTWITASTEAGSTIYYRPNGDMHIKHRTQ